MVSGVHIEVILAAAYAIFLMGAAFALELVARHSHRRALSYRTTGFVYRRKMDFWECPAGQQLHRIEMDYKRSVALYRAPAHACNSCSLKTNCTDSDEGRLLEHHLDSWIQSELSRFHRGISLALLLLATIILIAETIRHEQPRELFVAVGLLLAVGIVGVKLASAFVARWQE